MPFKHSDYSSRSIAAIGAYTLFTGHAYLGKRLPLVGEILFMRQWAFEKARNNVISVNKHGILRVAVKVHRQRALPYLLLEIAVLPNFHELPIKVNRIPA